MRKSTSSILVLAVAALFTSFQSYAQFQYTDSYDPDPYGQHDQQRPGGQFGIGQMISERVAQYLYPQQKIRLAQLLRQQNGQQLEVV